MHLWLIPMVYVAASVVCGVGLPRIEQAYLSSYTFNLSIASAQACLSAAASGMMALTSIVFAMAFVMVQFSAIAYSPRLVLWFARDRLLFHSLGAFAATFIYALFTLAWIDRGASGAVPLFSTLLVAVMLIYSMFLFSRLVQRLTDLQISSVLQLVGDKGREVIRDMFQRLDERPAGEWKRGIESAEGAAFGPVCQTFVYSGDPRVIAELNTDALVRQAQRSGAVIVMACTVGDTLVDGSVVLRVHGNPLGAPVGSRHRQQLNGEFIAALLRDFRQGGPRAIERVRRTQPASYLKILALLVPREHKVEHSNVVSSLTDEQLADMIAYLEERLARPADQAKLIEGEAPEIAALPACIEALKPGEPAEVMEAADTTIGPRERKPRRRKLPSPAGG
jgi:uncharacterized membrane protein